MTTPRATPDLNTSVSATNNPLVANFQITVPAAAMVWVEFGLDANFGFSTAPVPSLGIGGPMSILVAGMQASTNYSMRAVVAFVDGGGKVLTSPTSVFQTGPMPSQSDVAWPSVTVTPQPGQTPTPGVELINVIDPHGISAVSDLNGNIIWYYDSSADLASWQGYAFPIKLMTNGHMMASLTNMYGKDFTQPMPEGPNSVLREIDLAGNVVAGASGPKELWLADLNTQLQNVPTSKGRVVTAICYSHDFLLLPNGHTILIVQEYQWMTVGSPAVLVQVMGDALVDLDENFNVTWVWSAFDWLDANRQPPKGFPPGLQPYDWTHCNGIIAAPDGNLVLSSRCQGWLMKLDYQGGAGTGSVIWKFGFGGDFTWNEGNADWNAAQHFPWIFETNGTQITALGCFDNGNDRDFSVSPDFYSRAAIFTIDEMALTASLDWQWVPSPGQFSFWGGNVTKLASGNYEIAMSEPCAANTVPPNSPDLPSLVVEVTGDASQQLVWQMQMPGGGVYRATRLPSLYPGVQW